MAKINVNSWRIEDKKIIKRFRVLCKKGVLIELPIFKGFAKARFIDATNVKAETHGGYGSIPKTIRYKVIVYTVSSASGVIRTWIPLESVRFQNDGKATPLNPQGKNHNPDAMELAVYRNKVKTVTSDIIKNEIKVYTNRYKMMVQNGGFNGQDGALIRLLQDLGVTITPEMKAVGNIKSYDKSVFELIKNNSAYRDIVYPEYYMGYPVKY